MPNTDAALVIVVVVVAVASAGDRFAGTVAAVSSAVWFDFFLTEPYYRLTISRRQDLQTAALRCCSHLLLLLGVAVTEIGVRSARHRWVATQEAEYLAVINSVALQACGPGPSQELPDPRRVRAGRAARPSKRALPATAHARLAPAGASA